MLVPNEVTAWENNHPHYFVTISLIRIKNIRFKIKEVNKMILMIIKLVMLILSVVLAAFFATQGVKAKGENNLILNGIAIALALEAAIIALLLVH